MAIDPHKRHMAVAILSYDNEEVVDLEHWKSVHTDMAGLLEYWYQFARDYEAFGMGKVAIEVPDHIKPPKSNKQVSDLISVALSVGSLSAGFCQQGLDVVVLQPRTWKGKKQKNASRLEVMASVGREARAWDEHTVDAVALGLWYIRQDKSNDLKELWKI